MYWNEIQNFLTLLVFSWIVTLDVLKWSFMKFPRRTNKLNSNIRCIEMICKSPKYWCRLQLNSNIRCIEMRRRLYFWWRNRSWIVTLDVLKCALPSLGIFAVALNSNIRCIEMRYRYTVFNRRYSWIVTLDVLKYCHWNSWVIIYYSWIVTLDVLKWK